MDKNSFLEQLKTKYESVKAEESTIENLSEAIIYYENFIPDFFSSNGEAKAITEMYSTIREMYESGNEKTIECIDISKSTGMYLEYMEGMISFINDIKNINVSESGADIEAFTEKFNRAKEKDSLFIDSLYNGKLTETVTMPLSEAVGNIEFLIDFIPNLKTMKTNCCVVKESLETANSSNQSLLNDSIEMLCESVNNFCYTTISNVLDVYTNIQNAINGVSVTEKAPKDKFELF